MLNGSALLRVFLVVIAAAVLTGLVQHYWIFETSQPETPVAAARLSAPLRRPDPPPARPPTQEAAAPQAVKPPTESTRPSSAPPPVTEPDARNAAVAPTPEPEAQSPPPQIRTAPAVRTPTSAPPAEAAAEEEPAQDDVAAAGTADPRALDLVDLNTGSLTELNGLKGGGAIGRAIIQHRPYTSTDQLLSKRVLSRALYQRIKAQVTVR